MFEYGKTNYKTRSEMIDGVISVYHHNTKIVEHHIKDNFIFIDNGGYYSKTTKDRINHYLKLHTNYRLYQKNFDWFIDLVGSDQKALATWNYVNGICLVSNLKEINA